MRLSVVTVNWNAREDLRACLRSLEAQTHGDLEVLVVDNGSVDGSQAVVRAEFPRVRLLETFQNLGFAEACNRGILGSTGGWVALLNNDTVADPGWAEALVKVASAAPADVGMLQSLMLFQSKPDVINSTGIRLTDQGCGVDRGEGKPRPSGEVPEEIFCPTGGAAAYRRTMLEALRLSTGYLDRRFFLYYEDLDLGWRARLAGHRALIVPTSVVFHKYHGSTGRLSKQRLDVFASSNRIRTLLKNASPSFLAQCLPYVLAASARIAYRGDSADVQTLGRAVRDGLALRPEVATLLRTPRRTLEGAWVNR
jgi:GT2 family glycosyltransferase